MTKAYTLYSIKKKAANLVRIFFTRDGTGLVVLFTLSINGAKV
ncbi:hypothetical protein [Mucilaginibacter sp.]|nr:hypothetical protein [Mucilaginibacter sp.]